MRPYGDPRVWRKAQRRADRGIPTGRRATHPVKTIPSRKTRQEATPMSDRQSSCTVSVTDPARGYVTCYRPAGHYPATPHAFPVAHVLGQEARA